MHRGRRLLGGTLAALAALLASALPAGAAEPARLEIYEQLLVPTGGELHAGVTYSQGYDPLEWRACLPGGDCVLVDDGDDEPGILRFLDATPGTVFEVSATIRGVRQVARSDPWAGFPHVIGQPGVRDAPTVGRVVVPVSAGWFGGWTTDRSAYQTQVCPSPEATGFCRVIGDAFDWNECGFSGGGIPAGRYRGWYVRILERRIGRDVVLPPLGFAQPEDVPLAGEEAPLAVASPLIGPIAAPAGRPQSFCSAQDQPWPRPKPGKRPTPDAVADVGGASSVPPKATLRRTVVREDGLIIAAYVTCPLGCAVEVRLRHGGRRWTVRRKGTGTRWPVELSPAAVKRVRPGKVSVTVLVDGHAIVRGTVLLPGGVTG